MNFSIPFLLIYLRLLIGIAFPILWYLNINHLGETFTTLVIIGLVSDIFDGIIARKMGISSEKLRIWDSSVDQFFWLSVIVITFWWRIELISEVKYLILFLISLEGLCYLISYIKFRKPIATHTILAKIWTLSLLVFIIELLLYSSMKTFWLCMVLGIISRIEIALIIIKLKNWVTDVPSLLVVGKINRGEKIKKSKLFNS